MTQLPTFTATGAHQWDPTDWDLTAKNLAVGNPGGVNHVVLELALPTPVPQEPLQMPLAAYIVWGIIVISRYREACYHVQNNYPELQHAGNTPEQSMGSAIRQPVRAEAIVH